MAEIVARYDDGRIAVKKKGRKVRTCSQCGAVIPIGTEHVAIQNLVIFRKKYWKDEDWFCMNCNPKPRCLTCRNFMRPSASVTDEIYCPCCDTTTKVF